MSFLPIIDTIVDSIGVFFLFITALATVGIWLSAGKISDKIKLLTHQRNLDEKVELSMEIMTLSLAIQQHENEIKNLVSNRADQKIIDQKTVELKS